MAVNFKYSGRRITVTPTVPVAGGAFCRVTGFTGVPINNRVAGQSCAFAIEGVWDITWSFAVADVGVGTILYWNASAAALSIGASADGFPAVKAVTAPDANGLFQGLLIPYARPLTAPQA